MIVPHVRTPIALDDLPRILDSGYHAAIGTCPGWDVVCVAWAHLVLEHGRADGMLPGVWCNAIGNIDATPEERADPTIAIFATVPECELLACSARAVHRRRAFDSAEEGAAYYWASLRERFPTAFYAMGEGPQAFVSALAAGHYFTGDPGAYLRAVVALAEEARRTVERTF